MYCKELMGECIGGSCKEYTRWNSLGDMDGTPYCNKFHEFYPNRLGERE
jgi:hypothetical protein